MLIVKLAMLYEGVFALKKMVTSTAFATRLGWSISPGMPWSVSPGMGGQLAPEWSGHIHQNLQPEYLNPIGKLKSVHERADKSKVTLHHFWVNVEPSAS
jgi:hypothetical protein